MRLDVRRMRLACRGAQHGFDDRQHLRERLGAEVCQHQQQADDPGNGAIVEPDAKPVVLPHDVSEESVYYSGAGIAPVDGNNCQVCFFEASEA